jgi:hypothetical protein
LLKIAIYSVAKLTGQFKGAGTRMDERCDPEWVASDANLAYIGFMQATIEIAREARAPTMAFSA